MSFPYHTIPTTDVVEVERILYPDSNKHLTMDDSALSIMEDFLVTRPLVVDGSLSLSETKDVMKSDHVTLKLVINGAGKLVGIITLRDILGKKAAVKAHEMGVSLGDIQTQNIAQPLSRLTNIHIDHLKKAKIGDVLETVSKVGVEHILVIQNDIENPKKVALRGIISATKTAQMLNVPFNMSEKARSFSEIVYAVHGHFD